jgi:hypothetical protein
VTAPARIKQDDMARAIKAARAVAPDARIVFDLKAARIEIVLGESAPALAGDNWDDTDV